MADAVAAGHVRVAPAAGTVRGAVVVRPRHLFGRDLVELLVVDPAARRTGLGRALLRAAVHHATTDQVLTSTNESNAPMRALLASEGWELSGRLEGLDEGDPELVWSHRR